MRKTVGGVLLLAVALTGCSSTDVSGKDSSGPFTAKPEGRPAAVTATPVATRSVVVQPSIDKVVQVGAFCADPGVVAHNSQNVQTRCVKPSDKDQRARWVLDEGAGAGGSVNPGSFCPEPGAKGQYKNNPYTCVGDPGGKPRWRANN